MTMTARRVKGLPLTSSDHDSNLRAVWTEIDVVGVLTSTLRYASEEHADALFQAGDVIMTSVGGYRYRVAESAATDHHVTNAGGVKLYVLPGFDGFYPLLAFGAVPDNATDIYNALWTAIYKTPEKMARIDLGTGLYYCSKTFYLKKSVYLRGQGGRYWTWQTRIRFPTETKGFWTSRGDTHAGHPLYFFANVASMEANATAPAGFFIGAWFHAFATDQLFEVVAPDEEVYDYETAGGTRVVEIPRASIDAPTPNITFSANWFAEHWACNGTTYEEFVLSGTSRNVNLTTAQRTDPLTGAHGIQSQCRIYVKGVTIEQFAGCGSMVYADVSTKVSSPAIYGEASMCQFEKVLAHSNGGNGFHFQGYDCNAGTFQYLDAIYNGRWGVWDRSFLGNTHIGHHTSANGFTGAVHGNPANTGSRIEHGGVYYTAAEHAAIESWASEADLVAIEPGTDPTVWVPSANPTIGNPALMPSWESGKPVGTYFHGGAYKMYGANAAHVIIYCYTEAGQSPSVVKGPALVLGGLQGAGFKSPNGGSSLRATNGGQIFGRSFTSSGIAGTGEGGSGEEIDINVSLGGGSNIVLSISNTGSGGTYRLRLWNGEDFCFDHNNDVGTQGSPFFITGVNTEIQAGTGASVPRLAYFPSIGIGSGANIRRITTGTAAPSTGAWAKGDRVLDISADPGDPEGWVCTTAGTPGTWKSFGSIAE